MLLTVEEMIATLRSSVNVQVPAENEEGQETSVIDPAYLVMTDDDIKLFIKLGVSRAFSQVSDLSDLPDGSEYAIVLLAKIELYTKLAVLKANDVDLGADNNNYIKQDQRFNHYMKLVSQAKEQYDDWLENEGQGTVSAYDVLLSKNHYSHRNYEKQVTPSVKLKIDQVTSDNVDFSYSVTNTSHFGRFKVYISTSPIVNIYNDGATYDKKVLEGAKLIKSTSNIRDSYHRVGNLEPATDYYIAVFAIERNQVFGYKEVMFTTLEELEYEEDMSEESI